jgi:hypothetical protein
MRGLGYCPTLPSGFSAPTGKFDRTLNSRSEVRPAITMIREPPRMTSEFPGNGIPLKRIQKTLNIAKVVW